MCWGRGNEGVVLVAIATFAFGYTFLWAVNYEDNSTWTDCQTLVAVTPVGHRYLTSYYVVGDKGASQETDSIHAVGEAYCFSKIQRGHYRPYFTWWARGDKS